MKSIIQGITSTLLCLGAISCSSIDSNIEAKSNQFIAIANSLPSKNNSKELWNGCTHGMTLNAVVDRFPQGSAPSIPDNRVSLIERYRITNYQLINGEPFNVGFHFKANSLRLVSLTPSRPISFSEANTLLDMVTMFANVKYGKGKSEYDVRQETWKLNGNRMVNFITVDLGYSAALNLNFQHIPR